MTLYLTLFICSVDTKKCAGVEKTGLVKGLSHADVTVLQTELR
jgi:hypothetical protein